MVTVSSIILVSYIFDKGCHGVSLYTGYDETLLPLMRRGWILAHCHIRYCNDNKIIFIIIIIIEEEVS